MPTSEPGTKITGNLKVSGGPRESGIFDKASDWPGEPGHYHTPDPELQRSEISLFNDCVPVPKSALAWLFGEEGSFEPPQGKENRPYWWRSVFRQMIDSAAMRSYPPTPVPVFSKATDMEDDYWLIFFEEVGKQSETFTDEAAARHRYKRLLTNWNCHLFRRVD